MRLIDVEQNIKKFFQKKGFPIRIDRVKASPWKQVFTHLILYRGEDLNGFNDLAIHLFDTTEMGSLLEFKLNHVAISIDRHFRFCRECGCTEENACAGGCSWVEEDLCSKCVQS